MDDDLDEFLMNAATNEPEKKKPVETAKLKEKQPEAVKQTEIPEDNDEEEESDLEIILDNEGGDEMGGVLQLKPNQQPLTSQQQSQDEVLPIRENVNINGIGQFEGESIIDLDMDGLEDKPWRKPGADLTDYFNYGFNEATWRAYCLKQKHMKEDLQQRKLDDFLPKNVDYSYRPNISSALKRGQEQDQEFYERERTSGRNTPSDDYNRRDKRRREHSRESNDYYRKKDYYKSNYRRR